MANETFPADISKLIFEFVGDFKQAFYASITKDELDCIETMKIFDEDRFITAGMSYTECRRALRNLGEVRGALEDKLGGAHSPDCSFYLNRNCQVLTELDIRIINTAIKYEFQLRIAFIDYDFTMATARAGWHVYEYIEGLFAALNDQTGPDGNASFPARAEEF